MPATIYVTALAFETTQGIKDMDYHDRCELCDEDTTFPDRPGYHLKNANKLNVAPLPDHANVIVLSKTQGNFSIEMPANLRGCLFERAPDLPDNYAAIVSYWSGETINSSVSGAVYFQCPLNAYMVDLGAEPLDEPVVNDRLLSEGIVVAVKGLATLASSLSPDDFIECSVPLDKNMLGVEPDKFRSTHSYQTSQRTNEGFEKVYLKVSDILASPDADTIYIDLLCNELIDYGYWY
jgi:hypothetical protein